MSNTLQTTAEVAVSTVATKSTYAGTAATIGGYFLQSEFIALCGLVLAFLGFWVNLIFKVREDRRQREAFRVAMENAKKADEASEKIDEIAAVMRSNRFVPSEFNSRGGKDS